MDPFYPIAPGCPAVSVLMMSRRPALLPASLKSLFDNGTGCFDVHLKFDDDDPATEEAALECQQRYGQVSLYRGPRGNGFAESHLWMYELAQQAKGAWCLFWNDDAEMQTKEWDRLILCACTAQASYPGVDAVACLIPEVNGVKMQSEFPIFRRRMITETLRSCGDSPYADTWLCRCLTFLEAQTWCPAIKIRHRRDEVKDQVRKETDSHHFRLIQTLDGLPARRKQHEHAGLLLEAMFSPRPVPTAEVKRGWHFWQPPAALKPLHLWVDADRSVWKVMEDGFERIAGRPEEIGGAWTPH